MKFEISNLKLCYRPRATGHEPRVTGHERRLMAVLVVIFVISQACFSATATEAIPKTQNTRLKEREARLKAREAKQQTPDGQQTPDSRLQTTDAGRKTQDAGPKTKNTTVAQTSGQSGNGETIVERFRKQQAEGQALSRNEEPPLVREAKDFSKYLNPPPPPEPVAGAGGSRGIPAVVKPPEIVKFQLLATSVHKTNPELSLALIDLPGEGFKWVRPSSKVGYLVIKEIKDGALVIQDSQRTFEVQIEKGQEEVSLIKGRGTSQAGGAAESFVSTSVPAGLATLDFRPPTPVAGPKTQDAATVQGDETEEETDSAEQDAFVKKFLSEFDTITTDSNESDEAITEKFKRLDEITAKGSDQNRTQISGKEAQGLNRLGKDLNRTAVDSNRPAAVPAAKPATPTADKSKQPVMPRRQPARPVPRKP